MQKIEFSSPAVAAVYNEVKELQEKQSLGYNLIAYVGRKSYYAKRVMGCGEELWFTPRGKQWRKADRIEAVRPVVHHAEHSWESEDERPKNFRRSIRRPEYMDEMIDENTATEDWLDEWSYYEDLYN